MKYSTIKEVKVFCQSLDSQPDWREVVTMLAPCFVSGMVSDFEVDEVRFINSNDIDSIMRDELSSDEYILGCFNAGFLASVLDIDIEVIDAMQQAEAYEAIGKLVLSLGKLEELQHDYVMADGYGHHFNHYDGGEEELSVCGTLYYVFDNH